MISSLPTGIVDTHVHSAPDYLPRKMGDLEVVRAAADAGYRAVVLKSHHVVTADRAQVAQELVSELQVFGGAALNLHATGGINPYGVETVLRLGGRVIWLPTFTSANQVAWTRRGGQGSSNLNALGQVDSGVKILDAHGEVLPDVVTVLRQIADAGATLATGHIGATEIMKVVPLARHLGVANVIVTHPELSCVSLPIDQQVELAELGGVWFERVYVITVPGSQGYPLPQIAEAVRTVGIDTTIMASDFGQANNPPPVEGMAQYIHDMRALGFSQDELEAMTCVQPAAALGLGPA